MNDMKKKIQSIKFGLAEIILFSVLAVLVGLRLFVFAPILVSGESMDPTLENGERLIELEHTKLHRFDIVTLDAPDVDNMTYIKRIIGLPGETISFEDGQLFIDGEKVEEKYLEKYTNDLKDNLPLTLSAEGDSSFSFEKIPAGEYLVLGDNRRNSKDSRYFGFVDQDAIHGKIIFTLWK